MVDLQQLERERLDLVDHAVQRGLVRKQSAEDGVRPGPACPQLRECLPYCRPDRAPNPDLVPTRRSRDLPRDRCFAFGHASRFVPRLMTPHHKVLMKSVAIPESSCGSGTSRLRASPRRETKIPHDANISARGAIRPITRLTPRSLPASSPAVSGSTGWPRASVASNSSSSDDSHCKSNVGWPPRRRGGGGPRLRPQYAHIIDTSCG